MQNQKTSGAKNILTWLVEIKNETHEDVQTISQHFQAV